MVLSAADTRANRFPPSWMEHVFSRGRQTKKDHQIGKRVVLENNKRLVWFREGSPGRAYWGGDPRSERLCGCLSARWESMGRDSAYLAQASLKSGFIETCLEGCFKKLLEVTRCSMKKVCWSCKFGKHWAKQGPLCRTCQNLYYTTVHRDSTRGCLIMQHF